MGGLYLEIEGQSCLVDNVDRVLIKNLRIHQLGRITKKEPEKHIFCSFFPHGDDDGHLSASNSKNKFENVLVKLSAFH